MFDINKAIKAQKDYTEKKELPHFAPRNGVCWSCHQNIYSPQTKQYGTREYINGITVENASTSLITGCPHCNRSYCD